SCDAARLTLNLAKRRSGPVELQRRLGPALIERWKVSGVLMLVFAANTGGEPASRASPVRRQEGAQPVSATSPSTAAPYRPFVHSLPWRIPWLIECSRVQSSPGPAPRQTPCSINAWRSSVLTRESAA